MGYCTDEVVEALRGDVVKLFTTLVERIKVLEGRVASLDDTQKRKPTPPEKEKKVTRTRTDLPTYNHIQSLVQAGWNEKDIAVSLRMALSTVRKYRTWTDVDIAKKTREWDARVEEAQRRGDVDPTPQFKLASPDDVPAANGSATGDGWLDAGDNDAVDRVRPDDLVKIKYIDGRVSGWAKDADADWSNAVAYKLGGRNE